MSGDRERNVVLLCLDSVRKDYFDRYATRVPERADVSFEGCRAASSWSTPSHASMFTGLLPHQHGRCVHDKDFRALDRADTLLGDLPDHRAVGVSANVFAGPNFGFDTLFDEFVEVSTGRRYPNGIDPNEFFLDAEKSGLALYLDYLRAALGHDHPLASLANGVLAQVNVTTRDAGIPKLLDDGASIVFREVREALASAEPTFVFTNFSDAHVPLRSIRGYDRSLYDAPDDYSTDDEPLWDVIDAPENYGTYLKHHRDLYGAAIEYLDRRIDAFCDRIGRETDRPTTVVVTADHGENLGFPEDDGLLGHKSSMSESLLHVPLYVVDAPGSDTDGDPAPTGDLPGLASHLDLPELLAGYATGESRDIRRERVLAEVLGMSPGPDPPADYDRAYWDRAIRAAYEDDTKYVWDSQGGRERYRLDPERPCWQERIEDDAEIPEWALAAFDVDVETAKREAAETGDGAIDVDAATESRLEDLGYL